MNDNADARNRQHDDSEDLVPAAGGTFGVTDDKSGFGERSVEEFSARGDDADPSGAEYSGANYTRESTEYESVPRDYADAAGEDESLRTEDFLAEDDRYGVPDGRRDALADPVASVSDEVISDPTFGAATPGYRDEGIPAPSSGYGHEPRRMNSPEFGQGEPTGTKSGLGALAIAALACSLIGLVLLCFPGWMWIPGGVVGAIGLVLGVLAARKLDGRVFGWIAAVGGAVAVALAVATAIVVYVV